MARFFAVLGLAVVFVLSLPLGAILHVNLPRVKRVLLERVNQVLETSFQGRLSIDGVDRIGATEVKGARARLFDVRGEEVISARGVDLELDTTTLVRSLFGGPALDIHIDRVDVEAARVKLALDSNGELGLVGAFESRTPSSGQGRPVRLRIDRIRIAHTRVEGSVPPLQTIDADAYGLAAALSLDEQRFSLDVGRLQVAARNAYRGQDARFTVSGTLGIDQTGSGALSAHAELDGKLGDVRAKLAGDIDGDRVHAAARVPRTSQTALRKIVPELPLAAPAAVEAELSGTLPDLKARVSLDVGRGRINAVGAGRLGARPSLSFELQARQVSPRDFEARAPALRLSFDARGSIEERDEGRPYGELSLETYPTSLGATPLPALTLRARGTDRHVEGRLIAHEPGAPLDVDLALSRNDGSVRLELDAMLLAPELAKVARLDGALGGKLVARARARIALPEGTLDSRVSGSALDFAAGPATIGAATFSGTISGAFDALRGEISLRASKLRLLGQELSRADVALSGPLLRPHARIVASGPSLPELSASADLALEGTPSADDVRATIRRDGVRAELAARRIASARGGVRVDDARFSGAGTLSGTFETGRESLHAKARGEALELDKIAKLIGVTELRGGTASFEADVRTSAQGLHGRVDATLEHVKFSSIEDGNASIEVQLEGRRISGSLEASLGRALALSAVSERLQLPRGRFSVDKLRELRGTVALESTANLHELVRLLPPDTLPVGQVHGQASLQAKFVRSDDDRRIEGKLALRTRGLRLGGKGVTGKIETRQQALALVPWKFSGVDGELDVLFHNDEHPAHVALRLYDRKGTLLRARAEAKLPLSELVRAPETAVSRMLEQPMELDLMVPERSTEALPSLLRPRRLTGTLGVRAHLEGTPSDPRIALALSARNVRPKSDPKALPFDLVGSFDYEKQQGNLQVALEDRRRRVLSVDSKFRAHLGQWLRGGDPELRGSLALRARDFRLERVPMLADRQFRGRVVGDVELTGLGYAPKLEGELAVYGLSIAQSRIDHLRFGIDAHDGRLSSELNVRQKDGYLNASVDAAIQWERSLLPSLPAHGPLDARANARNFRAGVLLPIVDGSVSKLDGRVDASVRLAVAPGKTSLTGNAVLRDGSVQIPAIGQEFRKIRARVDLEPGGAVFVRDVSARGVVGRVRAAAAARFDGLRFVGARATATIAESEKLPITVEGVALGNAWGAIDLEARNTGPRSTSIDLNVRELTLDMPRLVPPEVQSLDDAEHIRIGVRQNGRFVTLPLQPLEEEAEGEPSELVVRVKLGKDVWIRQGTLLRVKLEGDAMIRVADTTRITGTIELGRGRLDVQGKLFELLYGSITLTGSDPPDPVVVARARWESPEGITVYADFSGPISSGKLTLTSIPALSQNEILALLLFGTPDGTFGAGTSSEGGQTAAAVGIGGGIATQGLNASFRRLTDLDVSARIDTSGPQPRPEVAVQVSRRLTAAVGYNVGEPVPGKPPDRTMLTLDFRLGRRWSLSSTFGDRGSSLLELVWRYRY